MVNVDKNTLINNLCQNSGLQGAALSEYKARLSKMSEAELTALISGNNTDNNTDTVELNTTNTTNTPIDKSTAQDLSIENIESNANQALQMLSKQDDGIISKTYNDLKEKFDLGLAKSQVEKVIYKQFKTADYLKKAKANKLTYSEYLGAKREFLMDIFPGIESYSDRQKAQIKTMIASLSIDELLEQEEKILNLPEKDSPEYQAARNKFTSELILKTNDVETIYDTDKNKVKDRFKPKPEYKLANGDRLMTFEEVYMLGQGVEFNKDNIQKSNESATTFALINNVKAKKDKLHEILHDNLKLVEGNKALGATKQNQEISNQRLEISILSALQLMYGSDLEKQTAALKELAGEDYYVELGQIKSNAKDPQNKSDLLPDIAHKILDEVDSNYNKLLGGKTLEDYAKEMADSYTNAYGKKDSSALASSYVQDQEGVVKHVRAGVEIVGSAVMFGGMFFFPPAALAGGALASFGGVGVEMYNEMTKEHASQEKIDELKKELATNGILMGIGMGAGKVGNGVKTMLTAKNAPKLFAMVGDIGADATISLLGDLALTGQIDLQGEGLAQVMSLIAGHRGKIVKGVQALKENFKAKYGPDAKQMPDGTVIRVNQDGSTTVLNDANSKPAISTETNIQSRLDNAQSREDFAAIREELKNMPAGAEKTALMEAYQKKYREYSTNPDRPDVRMEYNPEETNYKGVSGFEFVEYLKQQNILLNGKTVPRFDDYEIEILDDLVKEFPNDVPFIKDLLSETYIKSNGVTVGRFDPYLIDKIVKLKNSYPDRFELIKEVIKEDPVNGDMNSFGLFNSKKLRELVRFSKEYPNSMQFIHYLINIKNTDNSGNKISRYGIDDIKQLVNLLENNQENIQFIKELIDETKIDYKGNTVARFDVNNIEKLINFSNENPENIQFIKDLINETQIDYKGNTVARFDDVNILKLIDLINVNPEAVKILVDNPKYDFFLPIINNDNIHFFENETILNKIANQVDLDRSLVLHNNYVDNFYQLENGNKVFFVSKTDKGLEYNGSETRKIIGNKFLVKREFSDGSYLVEEINSKRYLSFQIPISLKKTQFDNNGVQVRSEVLAPSKDSPGISTINVYERGLNQSMVKKSIGTVELYGSKNQGIKTKRTVASSDGTVTTHTIIQGPKGSGMKYEIKDKDGNILGTTERQYRKIDDNHYTSSINGQKYDTQFVGDKVIVSKVDENGNITETIELGSDILDPQLIDLYKKLPGDYFFKIKEIGLQKISLGYKEHDNAIYLIDEKEIALGRDLKDDVFGFAHELGHAIDYNYNLESLHDNKELIKVYQEELAEYKKTSSDLEGYSIDYFISKNGGSDPIHETIAEFNALTSGLLNSFEEIHMRGTLLQQHFPRTCAKIMELMNK